MLVKNFMESNICLYYNTVRCNKMVSVWILIQAKVVIQVLLVKNNTGEKKNPYNYVCIYVQSILFTETDSLMIYCRRIWQHYQNVQDFFFRKRDADKLKKLKIWFDQQNSWMRNMIIKNKNDPMWRHVGLIMAQFDGLVAGYKSVAKMVGLRIKKLSIIYFLSHNFLLNTITMLKKESNRCWCWFNFLDQSGCNL